MTWLMIVCGAVATWRIAHMLLNESGPFSVFRKAREALGVVYSADDLVVSFKYEITVCIWCLSMWVGGLVALFLYVVPSPVNMFLLAPFVFSGVAGLLSKLN